VARKYRELRIPADNIVQDWFWWNTMGEPVFNRRYPDPRGMVDELHRNNFHLMISVWPYFRPGSPVHDDMERRDFFIDRSKVAGFHPAEQALYDAFNPAARTYYWSLLSQALFGIGVDAWWLDSTEPETEGREENILLHNQAASCPAIPLTQLAANCLSAGSSTGRSVPSLQFQSQFTPGWVLRLARIVPEPSIEGDLLMFLPPPENLPPIARSKHRPV